MHLFPIYFIVACFNFTFRVFMCLAPPCLRSRLKFEFDAPFPGEKATDRQKFAHAWYSPDEKPRDLARAVSSRFTFLYDKGICLETINVYLGCSPSMSRCCGCCYPRLTLPPMATDANRWIIFSPWWGGHILDGWVVVGENPGGTGWLLKGEFKCCPCFKWPPAVCEFAAALHYR